VAQEDLIESVHVATIDGQLPAPVVFGDWVMRSREFVVVRLRATSGREGWAFTLTRDGAVADHIRKTLAALYVGEPVGDQERLYHLALRRSLASHSAGLGLRALSIMDLAAWDLAARTADRSIADLLGGTLQPMPATAIIGYPPAEMGGVEVEQQTAALYVAGWRRFKAPIAASTEQTVARMQAARGAAPDGWLGLDAAWVFDDVSAAAELARALESVGLGWFEDVFPPGDASMVRQLREQIDVPVAMGDEQGGSYYPQALLQASAVDVVRIDLTCMGGITGGRRIVQQCLDAGVAFAPHMFAHVHSQVFSAWGHPHVPVEWGVPWTGVDPYADSLAQPLIVEGGLMAPPDEEAGFGVLLNRAWALSQPRDDPDRILEQ
jgi:L-alanine-DL-glutamate epimerase-like enolase superfamily enzyme